MKLAVGDRVVRIAGQEHLDRFIAVGSEGVVDEVGRPGYEEEIWINWDGHGRLNYYQEAEKIFAIVAPPTDWSDYLELQ